MPGDADAISMTGSADETANMSTQSLHAETKSYDVPALDKTQTLAIYTEIHSYLRMLIPLVRPDVTEEYAREDYDESVHEFFLVSSMSEKQWLIDQLKWGYDMPQKVAVAAEVEQFARIIMRINNAGAAMLEEVDNASALRSCFIHEAYIARSLANATSEREQTI